MIVLEDCSQVTHDGLWAQSVEIPAYDVVERSYVVWEVRITTLQGSNVKLWRRYAEFDTLRERLLDECPAERLTVPALPPKSGNKNLENAVFLNIRRDGLEYFLLCVLLNPHLARARAVSQFVRPRVSS